MYNFLLYRDGQYDILFLFQLSFKFRSYEEKPRQLNTSTAQSISGKHGWYSILVRIAVYLSRLIHLTLEMAWVQYCTGLQAGIRYAFIRADGSDSLLLASCFLFFFFFVSVLLFNFYSFFLFIPLTGSISFPFLSCFLSCLLYLPF